MKRSPIDYKSERLDEGLTVLEKLLDAPSRGYTVVDIVRLTGINYDKCYRALYTLMERGYARKFLGAWKPGDKCRVLAARTELAFTRQDNDVLALADSMRNY